MLATLRPLWPLITLLGSGALLVGAHAFQRFGGLQPCPLCLDQRNWHWAVVGVSLVALVLVRVAPKSARWMTAFLGCVLLGAAGMALYHVAVEQHWVIAQCDARVDLDNLSLDGLGAIEAPKCDQIAWSMFGVSMAGYNAIASLGLALLSFAVAFAPERKP